MPIGVTILLSVLFVVVVFVLGTLFRIVLEKPSIIDLTFDAPPTPEFTITERSSDYKASYATEDGIHFETGDTPTQALIWAVRHYRAVFSEEVPDREIIDWAKEHAQLVYVPY